MKLAKHLQQSHLLYLHCDQENIRVLECPHYISLNFGDITQSIMLKRRPNKLTLPHQYVMLMPLLHLNQAKVIELGLGGGNLTRFLRQLLPQSNLLTLEANPFVIHCFNQYFNPDKQTLTIVQQSLAAWLPQQANIEANWLIFDIYQDNDDYLKSLCDIEILLAKLPSSAWLTINLPNLAEQQLNQVLSSLVRLKGRRQLRYFSIPHYQNIIVHLYPKASQKIADKSLRPVANSKRLSTCWQTGHLIR